MLTARRPVITILLVTTAATSLAFATGAAVQPADGPNGKYARIHGDEIMIDISPSNPKLPNDFESVKPDALASAEGVFKITYTADRYARAQISHSDENVTFVVGGRSIEGEANDVTLART